MQAHEVPTHVQAEDKVLGWFTFQQVVGLIAVGALAYGFYRYAPIPWPEVRLGVAVVLALAGVAGVAGRIGGRRLPLVAADLLQYRLGGRCYAGTPAELLRSEPLPESDNPGLPHLVREKTRRRVNRLRALRRLHGRRRKREHRNGRRSPRLQRWLRSRRRPGGRGKHDGGHAAMWRTALIGTAALLTVAAVAASPEPTPTPEPTPGPGTPYPQTSPERWRNEIDFDPVAPVPGRRLFIESLAVFEEKATVTLRAATEVELNVQAFGGPGGRELRFYSGARVRAGQTIFYTLPLSGDAPSFTFAWVDASGQAGGISLKGDQLPHPLPVAEGELCDVRVTQLRWSPGSITGRLAADDCIERVEHPIDLTLVTGEEHIAGPMVMKTRVTDVYGTVTVSSGDAVATVNLDPPDSAAFRLTVPPGEAVHELSIEAVMEASLRGNAPPLVVLTLIPEREETRLVPVEVLRPGTSKTVRETVTVRNEDGTSSSHEISARLTIPPEIITVVPSVLIKHEEYIAAEVRPRGSAYGSREETVAMALTVGADAPYEPFTPPATPEPTPTPVQTPLTEDEADWLFGFLGWEWPW
ncbi:MAG: PrgI family protein [Chloroflexi bacterium]|nr:PrgI family protein [Chloroflexota bacterium]